jgi:hypothetical protein
MGPPTMRPEGAVEEAGSWDGPADDAAGRGGGECDQPDEVSPGGGICQAYRPGTDRQSAASQPTRGTAFRLNTSARVSMFAHNNAPM